MSFLDHLERIVTPDMGTLAVVAVLCAIAAYFIKDYLANPPLIIFVYPVMILCSLVFYYVFLETGQFNGKRLDQWLMWTILSSMVGTGLSIGTLLVAILFLDRAQEREPPAIPRKRVIR